MKSPTRILRRMATAHEEDALALMVDELFDLQEAIHELEARREKLRTAVLAACRRTGAARGTFPRGTLMVQRYQSYEPPRPSSVVDVLRTLRWEDDVLSVKGRALYKMAQSRLDTRAYFDAAFATREHETLVLTPKRR